MQMFRILVVPVINVEKVLPQHRVQVSPREFILERSPTAVVCAVKDPVLLTIWSSTWKSMRTNLPVRTPLESSGTFLKVPGQQASWGQLGSPFNILSQFPTKVPLRNEEIENIVPGQLYLFLECACGKALPRKVKLKDHKICVLSQELIVRSNPSTAWGWGRGFRLRLWAQFSQVSQSLW